MNPKKL